MKKLFISVLFISGFTAYAAYNYTQAQTASASAVAAPATTDTSNSSASVPVAANTSASASAPPLAIAQTTPTPTKSTPTKSTPTPTAPVKTSSGQYIDGTYRGSVEDAYYGNVQVEAVISGGRLSNVIFLQSPNDRSTSIYINKDAMPILIAEAIRAQSANVNGVSGASETSPAFEKSLASALSAAKA